MEHSEKPFIASSSEFDEDFLAKMKEILSSPYHEYVSQLKQRVVGKTVAHTQAGSSGFVLFFTDNDWVIAYLQKRKLHWEYGQGNFRNELLPLLNSSEYGDGSQRLSVNLPYASQTCDLGTEIANTHGKKNNWSCNWGRQFQFLFS